MSGAPVPADTIDPSDLRAACVEAFADYLVGPLTLSPAAWPEFLARQGVDLALSRVACDARGRPMAFAFVAPRPALSTWRLATMGAVPAARGNGSAPALLDDLAARAAEAGLRGLELEVFARNERACRLYRRHGFEIVAPLHGHDATADDGSVPSIVPLEPVPREHALETLARLEASGNLPFQLGSASLASSARWTAWQRGTALLAFADDASQSPGNRIVIRSLVDTDPAQRDAEALARALRAVHPRHAITMPPLLPPALGADAMLRAGFARQPLHQWWMRRRLG